MKKQTLLLQGTTILQQNCLLYFLLWVSAAAACQKRGDLSPPTEAFLAPGRYKKNDLSAALSYMKHCVYTVRYISSHLLCIFSSIDWEEGFEYSQRARSNSDSRCCKMSAARCLKHPPAVPFHLRRINAARLSLHQRSPRPC
jgi:hypothetical protein